MKFSRFIDTLEAEALSSEQNRALLRALTEKRTRLVEIDKEEDALRTERARLKNDVAALEARAARIHFREGQVA